MTCNVIELWPVYFFYRFIFWVSSSKFFFNPLTSNVSESNVERFNIFYRFFYVRKVSQETRDRCNLSLMTWLHMVVLSRPPLSNNKNTQCFGLIIPRHHCFNAMVSSIDWIEILGISVPDTYQSSNSKFENYDASIRQVSFPYKLWSIWKVKIRHFRPILRIDYVFWNYDRYVLPIDYI
jgi:hypothetical protein